MIIPKHNAIINIEVKLGPKDQGDKLKLLKDASDQTKEHFFFMQKLFGGMLSNSWVFVRAACVPHLTILEETTVPCVNCQQFILQDVNDVTPWLKRIMEHNLVTSDNHDQTVYQNLVAELIYHISIKESNKFDKLISDPLTVSRETEKAFTGKTDGISGESYIPKNMLTDEQLALTGKAERISGESSIPKNMLTDEQLALTEKAERISGESSIPKDMLTDEQLELTGKVERISGESSFPKNMLTDEQQALTRKAERTSRESSILKNMLTDEQLALAENTEGLSGDGNVPKNMLTYEPYAQLKLSEKIEELSEDSNVPVYMLNSEQLQAVHSPAKFLIIDGDYGTGKTYVLKERAKKCAIDNSKDQLFYIDMTTISSYDSEDLERAESSVMDIISVVDFDSYPNIKVITTKHFKRKVKYLKKIVITKALNSFLRDNHCDHLFIDEMIIGEIVFPDSIETVCVNLKVVDGGLIDSEKNKKAKWLETMKMNHNAVHVNLNKNMRNSQNIINLAKAFELDSNQQVSCSLDTNVIGNHNFYYRNIHAIRPKLLAVAAVNKYFIHKPKESVAVLTEIRNCTEVFEFLHKHFFSITSVVRDFREYMKKPEGIFVTSIHEFQGAQARNIIICDPISSNTVNQHMRNIILRTISHAIIILDFNNNKINSSGAIEDKNLHEYIYPDGKAPLCHHYHNEYKHDFSALIKAILEKYKLLDQDESISILTNSRISKDSVREANTNEFLSLPEKERREQIKKKVRLENQKLYEDVKRNISRNYADISWSYYHINYKARDLKDLVNKPRHINYINIDYLHYQDFSELKNIIIFTDENIDHKHDFAAWGDNYSLKYSDDETIINVELSNLNRNAYDTFCRDVIVFNQPKNVIVVHDDNFEIFSQPEGTLNLIKNANLHEHIPVTNTELSNQ